MALDGIGVAPEVAVDAAEAVAGVRLAAEVAGGLDGGNALRQWVRAWRSSPSSARYQPMSWRATACLPRSWAGRKW